MRKILSGLAMVSCLMTAPLAAQDVSVSADDLLQPYYDALRDKVELPVANSGAQMNVDTPLTRITFGSCNHQSRSQHMWAQIAATDPQLFMLIGDNVYGDSGWAGDAGLKTMRDAYAEQGAHPEFRKFREQIPMLTSWDDHDFGLNDSGGVFPMRRWSEEIYETFWNAPDYVRERPGIYDSRMVGPEGQRVQIILLDTRFFRSPLKRMEYTKDRPPLGSYIPDDSADAEMLGDAQWQWLETELAKPADLRMIVSSIQVLTNAHNFEAWETMPRERDRLFSLLAGREDSGMVLLSGDRHSGGVYKDRPAGMDEDVWEITSSSLNLAFGTTERNTAREPDPLRVTDFIAEENFGLIDIDWSAKSLTLSLKGNKGEERASETFSW